mmetsp:Transcript_24206/g.67058  ORF Transcript_24206/g.67058 Transcript_24206/m.67058 type:complete len:87 (-) Transcript_24206:42-302(-)
MPIGCDSGFEMLHPKDHELDTKHLHITMHSKKFLIIAIDDKEMNRRVPFRRWGLIDTFIYCQATITLEMVVLSKKYSTFIENNIYC